VEEARVAVDAHRPLGVRALTVLLPERGEHTIREARQVPNRGLKSAPADAQLHKSIGSVSGNETPHLRQARLHLRLLGLEGLQPRPLVRALRLELALALGDRRLAPRLQLRYLHLRIELALGDRLLALRLQLRYLHQRIGLALGDSRLALRLQLRSPSRCIGLALTQPLQVRGFRLRTLALRMRHLGGVCRLALRLLTLQLLDARSRLLLFSACCGDD
jgi:hypothetical protein